MSGRDRVFVDANELFPFSVMDLVLSLAEDLLIDFVWTDELLDEWARVIVHEGKRTPETARSVSAPKAGPPGPRPARPSVALPPPQYASLWPQDSRTPGPPS